LPVTQFADIHPFLGSLGKNGLALISSRALFTSRALSRKLIRIISQPPLDRSIGNEAKEYEAVVAAAGT